MKKRFLRLLPTLLFPLIYFSSFAQEANPYVLNGKAYQENCHCYTLTEEEDFQVGSLWNKNKINLTQSFDYKFNVYLGCLDQEGADGIVFVLQPISTSLGTSGQGLGFGGISPSVGITIDTWQNVDFGDPSFDHIGIYKNGDVNNYDNNVLVPPVSVLPNDGNIEDCQWHTFRIIWDAPGQTLSAQIDGLERVRITIDLVNNIFYGNPMVFWGFTGATGGEDNHQRVCTSLNPGFALPADQKTCYPTPILFNDSSTSFGSIIKWTWDFGDGTTDNSPQPPPHVYPKPGIYTASLSIVGNDGCQSDTFSRTIVAGSKPVADFVHTSPVACTNVPVILIDSSYVQYGTINNWLWDINDGQEIISNQSGGLEKSFPVGPQKIALLVTTQEGCISDTDYYSFKVFVPPATSMNIKDTTVCFNTPITFHATDDNPAAPVRQWYWQFGDGNSDSSATTVHAYANNGQFPVIMFAVSDDGCKSDTAGSIITVLKTNAYAGRDTIMTIGQSLQLYGSGGESYQWQPPTGLNDNNIAAPLAIIQGDIDYVLTAYTSIGCATSDTIHIKAYKGPTIYVPSAFTPNNDGRNDRFRAVPVGITTIYFFNVYNRFGQLVYSSKDVRQGWDGTFNGQDQPMGTYVWMLKGLDYLGKEHFEKGTVTLIR